MTITDNDRDPSQMETPVEVVEDLAEEPRLLAEGLRRPLGPGLVRGGADQVLRRCSEIVVNANLLVPDTWDALM